MLGGVSAALPDEDHRVRQPMTEEGVERLLECFALRLPITERVGEAGGDLTAPGVKSAMYTYLKKVCVGRRNGVVQSDDS